MRGVDLTPSPPLFPYRERLTQVAEELVGEGIMNGRNLAQMLWSLAKLGNLAPSTSRRGRPKPGMRMNGPLETTKSLESTESPEVSPGEGQVCLPS